MPQLTDKVAIITGVSSGIGHATALQFLGEGARVFGIDISPFPTTAGLTDSQQSLFEFHQCNLVTSGAIPTAVSSCKARFGDRIDILVNVAGVIDGWSSVDTTTDDEWSRVMAINLDVPVKLMREVLPAMKLQKSGAIVNVCSKASMSGAAAGAAYTASKHALAGVTKNVAWRFRLEGIRCNAVCPGATTTNIATSMKMEYFDPAAFAVFQPIIQLHCASDTAGIPTTHISPADIANGIRFLASDESKMINGVLLPIDTAWSTI
ncbi:putative Short chain dehydrogenase [Venustampulla echinocandica]|uniref:Putative Short chain dehydrogenase n=1 Tax=Venustampulla echinocandica TaxID=2656787 RepID=A0A370TKZ0_9HELO|nr:putative Short chain dehydrogenase [Venustampulla echinocandica]RDL36196.1 putative Short chain dehydrogenase [Venustampulla echinocandica]